MLTKRVGSSQRAGRWCDRVQWARQGRRGPLICTSPGTLHTLPSAGATRNSDPRPLPWGVLSLVAVALVFGVSVFVGLRQAQARGLQEGNRG